MEVPGRHTWYGEYTWERSGEGKRSSEDQFSPLDSLPGQAATCHDLSLAFVLILVKADRV